MASTISAGTTAGTALNFIADTTGNLVFQTNGTTTAMTIDTAQNVTFANGVTYTGVIGGNGANISAINASNISSGTIANARTTAASANGASTIVLRDTNGSFAGNVGTFTSVSGNGSALTAINASNVSSGTIATARLGTGTADSTTFLRGDGTWNAPAGGVTSLNGETGAITNTSTNTIGSYIVAGTLASDAVYTYGSTVSGSALRCVTRAYSGGTLYGLATPIGANNSSTYTNPNVSGTWRSMAHAKNQAIAGCDDSCSLNIWVRVS